MKQKLLHFGMGQVYNPGSIKLIHKQKQDVYVINQLRGYKVEKKTICYNYHTSINAIIAVNEAENGFKNFGNLFFP